MPTGAGNLTRIAGLLVSSAENYQVHARVTRHGQGAVQLIGING